MLTVVAEVVLSMAALYSRDNNGCHSTTSFFIPSQQIVVLGRHYQYYLLYSTVVIRNASRRKKSGTMIHVLHIEQERLSHLENCPHLEVVHTWELTLYTQGCLRV